MDSAKINQLEKAKATVAALEAEIAAERASELAQLPAKYGFRTFAAFAAAMKGSGNAGGESPTRRRTRAKITDQIRDQVGKLAKAGKTGVQIAQKVGISLPSVQNIKKALGLVTPRGKKRTGK